MKKILLMMVMTFFVSVFCFGQKLKFDVFATTDLDAENVELIPGTTRQNFTTLIINYNNNHITLWGRDYVIKETTRNVDGFATVVTFVCVDQYNQTCVIDYVNNPSKDWDTRNMFFVIFENQKYGKLLCSNDPVKIN